MTLFKAFLLEMMILALPRLRILLLQSQERNLKSIREHQLTLDLPFHKQDKWTKVIDHCGLNDSCKALKQ